MGLVYLIGGRGSGKTTIGATLAQKANCMFVDLDQYLCRKDGRDIATIVRQHGWDVFRNMEEDCLKNIGDQLANEPLAIVATGGGVVLSARNREFMRSSGIVFWLKADPDTLFARLADNPLAAQRPRLTSLDARKELEQTMEERARLYRESAHHVINANDAPELVCQRILKKLPPGSW